MINYKYLFTCCLVAACFFSGWAQVNSDRDSLSGFKYSIGVDVVSRYVWRGTDFGNSPAVQPTVELNYGSFKLGSWGSYAFNDYQIQEADLYVGYEDKWFSLTVWDYFYMDYALPHNYYFSYDKEKTGHDFSFDLEFPSDGQLPVKFLASYNFYGADTLHSAYLEATLTINREKQPFDLFIGATNADGWYGTSAGVVNVGASFMRDLEISDKFTIPLNAKFIFNPQTGNVFLVFGMTF